MTYDVYQGAIDKSLRMATRTGAGLPSHADPKAWEGMPKDPYIREKYTKERTPIGYVDLRSPAGAGLGALVYNYDGSVFASVEGRMLAIAP
jgi:hypothetical protein